MNFNIFVTQYQFTIRVTSDERSPGFQLICRSRRSCGSNIFYYNRWMRGGTVSYRSCWLIDWCKSFSSTRSILHRSRFFHWTCSLQSDLLDCGLSLSWCLHHRSLPPLKNYWLPLWSKASETPAGASWLARVLNTIRMIALNFLSHSTHLIILLITWKAFLNGDCSFLHKFPNWTETKAKPR